MSQLLHRISDRLFYMDSTVETDRPALGYIRGERHSAVVDAGNSPAHYRAFLSLLDAEGLPHPDFCILTHSHWDHTYGIAGLDIPSFACERTVEILREQQRWDFASEGDAGLLSYRENPCMQAEYANSADIRVALPTVSFEKRLTLDLGGVSAVCMHAGGPHSDDGVLVLVPQEDFLFAGDSCAGDFSLPNIAYDIPKLDDYTARLAALPFSRFMHAHRPIMTREETFRFLAEARQRGYYTFD